MGKRAVADEKEILKNFTELLRSSSDEVKISDRIKAAEFLAKHYKMLDEKDNEAGSNNVRIIDDIKASDTDEGGG